MKRRISLLLLFALVISLLFSCTPPHEHAYSEEYSSNDTHHWLECECGDAAGKSEHNFNEGVVTLYPTTSREGIMTYTCSVCLFEKNEKIAKLDKDHSHSYDIVKFDKTSHWNECVCGDKSGITAHSFDDGVITRYPTSEEEGIKTFSCYNCEFTKEEPVEKLDYDHTHEYNTEGNDEKSHWVECVCGAKENVVDHNFDEGVTTIPATDVEVGIKTFTCADCGRMATENIPAGTENGLSFLKSTHYRMSDLLYATPLTLEAEICVEPSQSGRVGSIMGNYYGMRQDWLLEIYENGVPRFYYTDAAGNIRDIRFTNVDVRTGEFVHVALTFDFAKGAITFYMDGEAKQTLPCEADLASDITRYQFVLGGDNRSDNGIYFQGKIRSVAAYADVRTAAEIAHSAQHGTNLYADDLILSYLLNKDSSGKDITDLSGNGYDIPKEWLDGNEVELDYAYSFAVIGDTQWLSKYVPEKMETIYDWILANKDDRKISHVFGLGDITEDWNTANKEQEWIRAYEYISKLDGVIPYSLVRGNHDESKYFLKYFANESYMSQFDGFIAEGDIRNSYKLFTIGSTDYLFLTLDFGASDEMLEWANEVVLAYPNHRVIVTTHAYQGFDGNHLSYDNVPSSGDINSGSDVDTAVGGNVRGYNNGKMIWEKFVSLHPNIFLVMCGHTSMDDVTVLQSEGVHGNTVTQMLIDPQWIDPQKGGSGMVCMLYFSEDGSQMEVEWISTDTGKYYKEMNQFAYDFTDLFGTEGHDFKDSYNENYHFKACDCGYTYNAEAHVFDGGVLNSDGFMVYSCACGYQRITSASDDPIAKALQEMLEKYYNGGVYYKDVSGIGTTYYGDNEFWTTDRADYKRTADYLTLYDLVMGRCGDLKLDLGWNYLEGVYSSANESTVKGMRMFLLSLENGDTSACDATRVTVEENGYQVIIKLWADDTLLNEATVGVYATLTLVNHGGETLGVIYAKVDADALCRATTPKIEGYVSEYDTLILDARYDELEKDVYYSTIAVWDGVSVSTSLKGSGAKDDPFLIESGADLAYIAEVINSAAVASPNFSGKYFIFTQSIDLNGHNLNLGSYTGWGSRKGLHGFVEGNHCTVRGLNNNQSLFGTIESGYLKNLSVYGKVESLNSGAETAGGIVGYVANGGVIENLTSYVDVNGKSTLGGVVGNAENNSSEVINCVNYGSVTGTLWNLGGIAGSGGHNITNCVNYGNVHSSGSDNVGGIAGTTKNTGSIKDCRNYGTISSVHGRVGGIAGLVNKPIVNCINYGDVNASWDSGGIVGCVNEGETASITGCINYGKVTGNTGMGGIFGFNHANAGAIFITDCVNNGEVSGTWGVGGIAGNTKAEVSGCVNNGYLTATGELGGIVGKCYGKVTECTNNGNVIGGQAIIGGIVGNLHVTTYIDVINSTNYQNGTVTGPGAQEIIGQ